MLARLINFALALALALPLRLTRRPRPAKRGLTINLATHTDTLAYAADRLRRDLARALEALALQCLASAVLFAIYAVAVALVPVRRAPSHLNVAASLVTVAAAYAVVATLCFAASPALPLTLIAVCVALAHLVQCYPADYGWWLADVQEVARELVDEPPTSP